MKAELLVALFPTVSQAPGLCLAHNRCSINIGWINRWGWGGGAVYAASFLPMCVKPERPSVAMAGVAPLPGWGCISFGCGQAWCLFRQSA